MKANRTFLISCAVLVLMSAAPRLHAVHEVVCVERAPGSDRVTLEKLIASFGYNVRNPIAEIESGSFRLKGRSILVLAARVTSDPLVGKFLEGERDTLQRFVRQGGCVVVFAQDGGDAFSENWLVPGMQLLRGGQRTERLDFVDREHPLFSSPCAISHRRLNRNWTHRALSAESFRLALRARIVAAQESDGRNPWCVEFGWGQGRAIFFACEPLFSRDSPAEARRIARDLVENALAYAVRVVRGSPAPLPDHAVVVEASSGNKPRSWVDSKMAEIAFEAEVNASVDRGVAYLLDHQRDNGCLGRRDRYEVGRSALGMVALLGTGVSKHKESIKKGIDYLVGHQSTATLQNLVTYEVALVMMALDAYAAPLFERFELEKLPPEKRESFQFVRTISDGQRAVMTRCVDWLVKSQLESGYWSYSLDGRHGSGDLSNTQFAILGLRAASRCGVDVPAGTWVKAIDALLRSQATSGEKVNVPEIKSPGARTSKPSYYVFQARARPWGYRCNSSPPNWGPAMMRQTEASGSRTAMGISSLLIAHEGLALISKQKAGRSETDLRKAVRDGIGWLWINWSVAQNPGMDSAHHLYYLYALERVGVLAGKRFLGDRDWYREGAAYLLGVQSGSGDWGDGVIDTCFALLFLKRSTPPPVITPGG